jgi:hypothetical protein
MPAVSHVLELSIGSEAMLSVNLRVVIDVSLSPQAGNGLKREHYPHGQSGW